jgi:phage shock protein PspC (stress-responsive transcriptional regulator)
MDRSARVGKAGAMTGTEHTPPEPPRDSGRTAPPRPGATGFFDWIRATGVRRGQDGWAAGVCAGIARRTGLDPLLVRGIFLVVAVLGGPALLVYAAGWALLPDAEGSIHAEGLVHGVFDPAMIAIMTLSILGIAPWGRGIWVRGAPDWLGMPDWLETLLSTAWTVLLIAGIIWLIVYLVRRYHDLPRPTMPPPTAGDGGSDGGPDGGSRGGPDGGSAPHPSWQWGAWSSSRDDSWRSAYDQDRTDRDRARREHAQDRRERDRERAQERRQRDQERRARERERNAVRRERASCRQPSAGFVAISLGLAVAIGALTGLSAYATGWSDAPVVIGIAACVVVLGIATAVAGIRGRESGGLGFFSFLAVIALVLVGVLPSGTRIIPFGDTVWDVTAQQDAESHYTMIAGSPTLDLRPLSHAPDDAADGRQVDLWLGAGTTTVIVPDDVPAEVTVDGLVTGVDSRDQGLDRAANTLMDSSSGRTTAARTASADEITTVRIHILFGTADVDLEEQS